MATRATYFLSQGWQDGQDQMVCFYVHHDGCPKGAACKFFKMNACKNNRSSYAGKFFRANDNAEFANSQDYFGDIDYRYEIDSKGTLKAWQKEDEENKWKLWKLIYNGPWFEFVNDHIDDDSSFLYAFGEKPNENSLIMTISEAEAYVEELMIDSENCKKGVCYYTDEIIARIKERINFIKKEGKLK